MGKWRNDSRRWAAFFGAALLGGILFSTSAWAQSGPSAAEQDVVEAVSTALSTVTIGGEQFAVTPSSQMTGADGNSIALYELNAANGSSSAGDMVEYTVTGPSTPGGAPEIDTLQVLDGGYE